MNLVIVESPAKAKTIERYLGSEFKVLASYGHVRDLIPKDGSVLPDENFKMIWEKRGDKNASKNFSAIASAVKQADRLILATDPDREGEAIAWHVLEMLNEKKLLKDAKVERISFNAITKASVQDAMKQPRSLDQELIDAYLARRALDYLVGFNLSPVLWRKLPGSRSAGRVQSVALRLICEREIEIETFVSREYWTIDAKMFGKDADAIFSASATAWNGEKLEKFSLPDEATAERLRKDIENAKGFRVQKLESKEARRNPAPPFITSSLQQEASRKLGFPADRTMRIAQRLYEGVSLGGGDSQGLITYMRTDGVQMAPEAVNAVRKTITERFDANYLPEKPRFYKSKAKNAQEAHEAIRPVDPSRHPNDIRAYLSEEEAKLYELIWKRAIASQMASARLRQTRVDINAEGVEVMLRANGSVMIFDGFLKLYRETVEGAEDDRDRILPPMEEGEALQLKSIHPEQHFTEPPPRFTEASLVKRLEELGIGRPSTYASTLSLLRDRGYVVLQGRALVPEDRGRIVTAFLEHFFEKYLDYDFTAQLEESLDSVSAGKLDWKQLLGDFWRDFFDVVEKTKELRITEVLDHLNESLASYLFPEKEDGSDPRECPTCKEGNLSIKVGRFGAFVGCSRYPDCRHTRPFAAADGDASAQEDQSLGTDPDSGEEVVRKSGRFGPYLQLGEGTKESPPKRVSIPPSFNNDELDLEKALSLLALPREIGEHPESKDMIVAGLGRYGPYLLYQKKYTRLESVEDALTIGVNRAVEVLAQPKPARRGRAVVEPLRKLGEHPDDGEPVNILSGRYGPYVKHGKINATIPRGREVEELTLEEAVELIAERAAKVGAKKPRTRTKTKTKTKAKTKTKTKAKSKSKSKTKTKSKAKTKAKSKTKVNAKAEAKTDASAEKTPDDTETS
ncbi:MAG: type I DNA topoisomerase [Hyphomicrobiales bacterium]|nr:type I DNA topoisomerase [Hyphomicrobiales bacterium]